MTAPLAKAHGRFSETTIDEEIVVMSLDSGDFFSLSGTSAAAWRLIDGSRDRDKLVAALAADFGVSANAVAPDIDAFLAQLHQAGFLVDS